MIDHHVHVTGLLFNDTPKEEIHAKLKSSLDDSKITQFIGIIAAGSLFPHRPIESSGSNSLISIFKIINTDFGLLTDSDGKGLSIVHDLHGIPAVFVYPYSCKFEDYIHELLTKMRDFNIKILKIYYADNDYAIDNLLNLAADYGITHILFHTPSKVEIIMPVLRFLLKKDYTIILGHGCYENREFMDIVKEGGFYVDTAINPLTQIQKWIDAGLERQLVFGSDWPCNDIGDRSLDWHGQKRELTKIQPILKIIERNRCVGL